MKEEEKIQRLIALSVKQQAMIGEVLKWQASVGRRLFFWGLMAMAVVVMMGGLLVAQSVMKRADAVSEGHRDSSVVDELLADYQDGEVLLPVVEATQKKDDPCELYELQEE